MQSLCDDRCDGVLELAAVCLSPTGADLSISILFLLCRADVMTDVVEFWNWLLSACPRQELIYLFLFYFFFAGLM
jgi:hypothetical protein